MKQFAISILSIFFFFLIGPALASDHVDGANVMEHPAADIADTYAFVSPANYGKLVLILNSYPFVGRQGHFSDQLRYSLLVKPLRIAGVGAKAGFIEEQQLYRFDCTFVTPHDGNPHKMTCTLPSGESLTTRVNDESGSWISGVRAFAGKRAEPFLFNTNWFSKVIYDGCIPPATAKNDLSNMNILSIVLEVDVKEVFNDTDTTLFAISSEMYNKNNTSGKFERIDREGRPEIGNAHLVPLQSQEDLRERYNHEDLYALSSQSASLYRQRILENITYYDALDGIVDWHTEQKNAFVRLLLRDYLVVDTSKPFARDGYLNIERSMLNSRDHTRSGGRVPGDHVINTLTSMLINADHGPAIVDGISPQNLASDSFPYLGEPNSGIITFLKSLIAPRITKPEALRKRSPQRSCN